jgi:hypothetical protein
MTIYKKKVMLKGIVHRDRGNLVVDSFTYYGEVINNGLEFKLVPLMIPFDEHFKTNTKNKDPFVINIKNLLKSNKFNTDNLKIKSLDKDKWEVLISD